MPPLSFVVARYGIDAVPLLAGMQGETFVGLSIPDGQEFTLDPGDVVAVASTDPAAVYWGVRAQWAEQGIRRAADAPTRRPRRLAPQGQRFDPTVVPESGFQAVQTTLLRHRATVPTVDTIRLSSLFAVSTVRTSIEQAEKSFNCFVELYEQHARQLPAIPEIRGCFRGLQNSKSRMFYEVATYSPAIQQAIGAGMKDRELRRHLVRETDLPVGLGIAKMSFTLALLGHDCVCLDARILGRMFGSRDKATQVESGWGKSGTRVSELALQRYESVENAFLARNPFYRAGDPIGRARAQWMSWESVGGEAATHSVWLRVVTTG